MKSRITIFTLVAACLAATLVGCSSSSSKAPQVSIALSVVSSTIAEGASTKVYAVVTNDTNNSGVTWGINCGGSSCGTLSGASPNFVLYTAPPTVTGGTVTITATSVADPSVTATASFTIAAATTLGDGTYVFALAGQDGNGLYQVAGAIVVSGGAITGGEQDFVDPGNSTQENKIANGTIKTSRKTSNIQINLNVTPNINGFQPGNGGVETLDASIITGVHALVTEYDASATSSGTLDLQTSTGAPAGGCAFVLSGLDGGGAPAALGGVLNIDTANGLDGSGSVFDLNDGFNVTQDQPVDSGTISTTDPLGLSLGRVTISLVLQNSGFGGIGLIGYVVDANHIHLIENNNDPNDIIFGNFGHLGGTAFGQGTNAGSFTASSPSVSGASYVLGTIGMDTFGPYQVAGVVTLNSDLSASATLDFNDLSGSAPTTPVQFTGTYTIDATGRVTLTNLTDPTDTYIFSFQMYLDGNGNATVMSIDSGLDEVAGAAAEQAAGASFSASSFSGSYGLDVTGWSSGTEMDEVGSISADGTRAISGVVDQNDPFFIGELSNVTVSGTFTAAANGVFTDGMMGLDVTNGPGQMDVFNYYLIDPTRVVAIETDQNQLTLGYFELKQ